jgi:hypothetical protein
MNANFSTYIGYFLLQMYLILTSVIKIESNGNWSCHEHTSNLTRMQIVILAWLFTIHSKIQNMCRVICYST